MEETKQFPAFPICISIAVPGTPKLTLTSAAADSISFSWTVPRGTVVELYELMWNIVDGSQQTVEFFSDTASNTTDKYTVTGLDMYDSTIIEIMVTAVYVTGSNSSATLSVRLDFLQSGSENCGNVIFSILGSVGSFLVGVVAGTVSVIILFKLIRKCRKNSCR